MPQTLAEAVAVLNSNRHVPCTLPWTRLEERNLDGDCLFCCWSNTCVGKLDKQGVNDIPSVFNGKLAGQVRDDILGGRMLKHCPRNCLYRKKAATALYDYPDDLKKTLPGPYVTNVINIANNVVAKTHLVDTHPVRIKIHPSNVCNIRCRMCNLDKTRSERASDAYIASLFKELVYLNDLNIFGGEPFACPTSRRIMASDALAAHPHVHLSVVTNGTLLTDPVWELLKTRRLGQFVFSIDGYTKEVFESIRLGAGRDTVYANLERLVRLRDTGAIRIQNIGISFAIQKRNHHEIPRLIEYAHDKGLSLSFCLVFGSFELHGRIEAVRTSLEQGLAVAEARGMADTVVHLRRLLADLPEYAKKIRKQRYLYSVIDFLGRDRVTPLLNRSIDLKKTLKKWLRI